MSTAPQLFVVTCSCGEKFRVRSSQAGEQLQCKCGATVSVPTIRALKQLETVKDEQAVSAATPSTWQGPIFATGVLALFVGCLVLAGTALFPPQMLKADIHSVGMTEADVKRAAIATKDMGILDLMDEFVFLRDRGRNEQVRYVQDQIDQARRNQQNMQFAGAALAGVGALLTIVGLVFPLLLGKR
jgi:hypothetical protein